MQPRAFAIWAIVLLSFALAACQVSPTPTFIPIPTATYIPTEIATETEAPTEIALPTVTGTPGIVNAVVTDTLRVRDKPSTTAAILGRLKADTRVRLLARKDDNEWFEIEYPPDSGKGGWIAADFVVPDAPIEVLPIGFTSPPPPPGAILAKVKELLRVRSGPGTNYETIARLPADARVTLLARSPDGEWYQIIHPPDSGKHVWIKGEFLDLEGSPDQMPVATPPPTATPVPTAIPTPTAGPATATAIAAARRAPTPVKGTPASLAPSTGHILVTSNRGGSYDIYDFAENGVMRSTLSHLGQSFGARFSPDARRVVFYHVVSTSPVVASHIYAMNADGSGVADLSRGAGGSSDSDPDWSPDGTRIAFVRTPRAGAPEIWVMNADGSGAHHVVTLSPTTGPTLGSPYDFSPQPRWSPDGGRIAFAAVPRSSRGAPLYPNIFVVSANGSGEMQLTDNDAINSGPVWSPDGTQIAWSSKDFINRQNWRVSVMSAGGGNQRRLISGLFGDPNNGVQIAAWQGNRILLAGWTGSWNAYLANADGSGLTPVTREGADAKPSDWRP